jgi:hypothetical protein
MRAAVLALIAAPMMMFALFTGHDVGRGLRLQEWPMLR